MAVKCPKCQTENPDDTVYCGRCAAPLESSEKLDPDISVHGKYRILEKLGEGGMGVVYKAQDTILGREVALKFLSEDLQQDETGRKRFLREAKSAAALDHPFICKIFEIGEADGKGFISMEYVEGQTLRDKLVQGPLPMKQALQVASEIAEALEKAHRTEIVHRDLKPSNVMLTPDGHVKVMDFGLAKRVAEERFGSQEITLTGLTKDGSTIGTVTHMSPEQLKGKAADTRSDIFSFGVTLYEMLAGVHPFKKPDVMETAGAILNQAPPPLARYREETSQVLQHIVRKMLAKEPNRRYQLIHEVRTDLSDVMDDIADSSQIRSGTDPDSRTRKGPGTPLIGRSLWNLVPWVLLGLTAAILVLLVVSQDTVRKSAQDVHRFHVELSLALSPVPRSGGRPFAGW